jgi:hypothetical protein
VLAFKYVFLNKNQWFFHHLIVRSDFVLAFEAGRLIEAAAQRSRQGGEGGEGGGGREGTGGGGGGGGAAPMVVLVTADVGLGVVADELLQCGVVCKVLVCGIWMDVCICVYSYSQCGVLQSVLQCGVVCCSVVWCAR